MERLIRGSLEDNIVTLLCWSESASPIIRIKTSSDLFATTGYGYIVQAAFDYLDEYRCPPKEHISDLLEDYLKSDSPTSRLLKTTLINMQNTYPTINENYVLAELDKFIKSKHLQRSIEEASMRLSSGDVEGAEEALNTARTNVSTEPGLRLNDPEMALSFLSREEAVGFPSGIESLDCEGIFPRKKQLFLIMAPTARGKTWSLVHYGKQAMLYGKKVLFISLEMSEEEVAERYMQSLFSLVSHHSVQSSLQGGVHSVRIPDFELNGTGDLLEIVMRTEDRLVLSAENEEKIKEKVNLLKSRSDIIIKSFPSGSLSTAYLRSYLEMMERMYQYKPDVVLLDYPDIMKMPKRDEKRSEVGDIYVEIRGLAQERDFALVTATQANRVSMQASIVKDYHASEDISKIATSDYVISINQTDSEKALGLARLYVAKARFAKSGFQVIISQNLSIGQFCLDSLTHTSTYSSEIRRLGGMDSETEAV